MKAIVTCFVLCWSFVFSCGTGHAAAMNRVRPINYDLDKISLKLTSPGYYLFYKEKLIRFSATGNYYDIYTIIERYPTKSIGIYAITYFADGSLAKGGKEQITVALRKNQYADIGGTEETLNALLEDTMLRNIVLNEPVTAVYRGREHIHPNMGINTICEKIRMSKGKAKYLETKTSLGTLLDRKVAYDHYTSLGNLVLDNARENDSLCITGILYMDVDSDAGERGEAIVFFSPLSSKLEGRAKLRLTQQSKQRRLP